MASMEEEAEAGDNEGTGGETCGYNHNDIVRIDAEEIREESEVAGDGIEDEGGDREINREGNGDNHEDVATRDDTVVIVEDYFDVDKVGEGSMRRVLAESGATGAHAIGAPPPSRQGQRRCPRRTDSERERRMREFEGGDVASPLNNGSDGIHRIPIPGGSATREEEEKAEMEPIAETIETTIDAWIPEATLVDDVEGDNGLEQNHAPEIVDCIEAVPVMSRRRKIFIMAVAAILLLSVGIAAGVVLSKGNKSNLDKDTYDKDTHDKDTDLGKAYKDDEDPPTKVSSKDGRNQDKDPVLIQTDEDPPTTATLSEIVFCTIFPDGSTVCLTAECRDEGCACDFTAFNTESGEVTLTCDTCTICRDEDLNHQEATGCNDSDSGEQYDIDCNEMFPTDSPTLTSSLTPTYYPTSLPTMIP